MKWSFNFQAPFYLCGWYAFPIQLLFAIWFAVKIIRFLTFSFTASDNNSSWRSNIVCSVWYKVIDTYFIFLEGNFTVAINPKQWKGRSSLSWLKWLYVFFNKRNHLLLATYSWFKVKSLTFNFASPRGGTTDGFQFGD